jgi:dipeptidyl aminopeptidase/acylaminoacyl peptidase
MSMRPRRTHVRRLALLLLAGLAGSPGARAAAKHAITIDDLIAAKVPSEVTLSPDGTRVAFTVRSYDADHARFVHQIHVRHLPDGVERQYTFREEGATRPRWSPDGRRLAFLSQPRAAAEESEGPTAPAEEDDPETHPQIHVMPADGGEARTLTHLALGVEDFEWRPGSGDLVALAEEAAGTSAHALRGRALDDKDDGVEELAERRRHFFWSVEAASGDSRRLGAGDYGIEPPFAMSPDGKWIVYATNLTGGPGGENAYDLYVLDLATGAPRRLTSRPGSEKEPRVSPDGRLVSFAAPAQPDISFSRTTLFVVPAAGGEIRAVSARSDLEIEEGDYGGFTADGRILLAVVHRGTDGPIWAFDVATGDGREIVGGTRLCSSPSIGRSAVAFVAEGPREPAEVRLAAPDGSGQRTLTDLVPEVREWDIAEPAIIRWRSFDGREVEGILVKPRGWSPGRRAPLLVYPHGGPKWRDPNILLDDRQAYAAQGYAVLLPQYRGSTGYGNAWQTADMKDLGGGDFRDLMSGVDRVIEMGIADPDRLGIFGGSYGGYLTNWAITQTDRFKGAVSWYGIWNLVTDFGNSFYTEWEPDYLRARYWDDWETYLSRSPARYVKKVTTPVLILHGEEDDNTNIANSYEMWTALRALGKTVEFVHYPREGHGFTEPTHLKDVFRRTLRHMDRYVKGGAAAGPRVGERVSAGGLQLLVSGAEIEEAIAGRSARRGSVFLEVTLTLSDLRPRPGRLSLRAGGAASEVRLVDGSGRGYVPVGALAPALGETILYAGQGDLAVEPDEEGRPRDLAAVLVFEVPDRDATYRIEVKDFRPVALEVAP